MSNLSALTPAERQASLEKARISRAVNTQARAASSLRRDFAEESVWLELARSRGIRLPPYGVATTPGQMEKFLRKLNLSTEWYREWSGFPTLAVWPEHNPTWPLRAFVGLLLEVPQ